MTMAVLSAEWKRLKSNLKDSLECLLRNIVMNFTRA